MKLKPDCTIVTTRKEQFNRRVGVVQIWKYKKVVQILKIQEKKEGGRGPKSSYTVAIFPRADWPVALEGEGSNCFSITQ